MIGRCVGCNVCFEALKLLMSGISNTDGWIYVTLSVPGYIVISKMPFDIHLPLNAIDTINQPPLHYLQVQDALILSTGLFWTIAYILYIRQAYRDESYGMPIVAL